MDELLSPVRLGMCGLLSPTGLEMVSYGCTPKAAELDFAKDCSFSAEFEDMGEVYFPRFPEMCDTPLFPHSEPSQKGGAMRKRKRSSSSPQKSADQLFFDLFGFDSHTSLGSTAEAFRGLRDSHADMKSAFLVLDNLRFCKCYIFSQITELRKCCSNIKREIDYYKEKRARIKKNLDEQRGSIGVLMSHHKRLCDGVLGSGNMGLEEVRQSCSEMHQLMVSTQSTLKQISKSMYHLASSDLDSDSISLRDMQLRYFTALLEKFEGDIKLALATFNERYGVFCREKSRFNSILSEISSSGGVGRAAMGEFSAALKRDFGDYEKIHSKSRNPVHTNLQPVIKYDQFHTSPVPAYGEEACFDRPQEMYQQNPMPDPIAPAPSPALGTGSPMGDAHVSEEEHRKTMQALIRRLPEYNRIYQQKMQLAVPGMLPQEGGVEMEEARRVQYEREKWEGMEEREDEESFKIQPTIMIPPPLKMPNREQAEEFFGVKIPGGEGRAPQSRQLEEPPTEKQGASKTSNSTTTIFCEKKRIPDQVAEIVRLFCIQIVEREERVMSMKDFEKWTQREKDTGLGIERKSRGTRFGKPMDKCSRCRGLFVKKEYKNAISQGGEQAAAYRENFKDKRRIPTYYSTPMCDCDKLTVCLRCRILDWMYTDKHRLRRAWKENGAPPSQNTPGAVLKRKRKRRRNRSMQAQSFVEDRQLAPLVDQSLYPLKATCHGCSKGWHLNNIMAVRPDFYPPWPTEGTRKSVERWMEERERS